MQQYSNCAGWLCVWTCATAGMKYQTHGSSVMTRSLQSYLWVQQLNRLFLGFHDVWQGGIARLVQPQVSGDDSWQATQQSLQPSIHLHMGPVMWFCT